MELIIMKQYPNSTANFTGQQTNADFDYFFRLKTFFIYFLFLLKDKCLKVCSFV
uniref:Uncharacterized protein n=1 Tax=Meloidogyne enterolobii TaxID=390850 RepID=A0A6V7UAD5_MELEN|nr:unnamed protein product [Meloidogyne enterolobii]